MFSHLLLEVWQIVSACSHKMESLVEPWRLMPDCLMPDVVVCCRCCCHPPSVPRMPVNYWPAASRARLDSWSVETTSWPARNLSLRVPRASPTSSPPRQRRCGAVSFPSLFPRTGSLWFRQRLAVFVTLPFWHAHQSGSEKLVGGNLPVGQSSQEDSMRFRRGV